MRSLLAAAFLIFSTSQASYAVAAEWPDKPITVIVPSAAGGSADVLTRLVLNRLAASMGATFVVENRPGAAGSIGMTQTARAQPDGYTLGYGNINTLAVNPALFNTLPYKVDDFAVVGRMFDVYNLLVVNADAPIKSVADLVQAAKAKPGALSYGAASIGSSGHMGGELFKYQAGINTLFVPYTGDPASLADLAGGRLDYTFTNASVAWPLVQSGKLRALAITSRERVPFFPDLPTLAESGLPDYENVSWGGLVFPKGTPDAIVNKLSNALQEVLASQALKDDLAKLSARPGAGDREAFSRYIAAEQKKWAELIDSAKIEKQN